MMAPDETSRLAAGDEKEGILGCVWEIGKGILTESGGTTSAWS
jgi:hypothetical protein